MLVAALIDRSLDRGLFARYKAINTKAVTPKIIKISVSRNCDIFDSAVWLVSQHNNFKKSQDGGWLMSSNYNAYIPDENVVRPGV